MVKKRVDPRVRGLILDGVRKGHRSLFILVGDHGKDQVENLHKILSKARVKSRPSVLWCYKKELGFSTHRKKRIQEIKRNQARGLHDPDRDDPFDLFISSTNIRWTYYKESEKILGQTFGMCVLQDFEALTPNLLARTIETVEGGGLVIILMKTVKSLKQLYTMSMDVHSRFRTEAHHEIVPRFNERFILSLGDCHGCLMLDDELNILPFSSNIAHLPSSEGDGLVGGLEEGDADASGMKEDPALVQLKGSLANTPNAGSLVELTRTLDQANAVMSFLDAISEKTLRSTVALTAARGRGKSAAIGLCLAGAVAYGYSNIFVTAPSPENLTTVFEFVIGGLKALKFTEHIDFEVLQDHHGEAGKVVTRINIFRDHRQTIQYILPTDHAKLAQAELVAIDEAAAIPLPTVKKLMGPYLVFLSSTVNGYEGTGRALSLKLIQQLRAQQGAEAVQAAQQAGASVVGPKSNKGERHLHEDRWKASAQLASSGHHAGARVLTELTLTTPIRYNTDDPVEKWLNNLLCLDVTTHSTRMVNVMPAPKDCELYMVNRDALFSYHPLSELLLQRIWALYTAAHYKNSPNDLHMLSDAPAHRLFVLLGPQALTSAASGSAAIPDVLCVLQVAYEGFISQKSIQSEIAKGNKASGDMIPWTISQQFNDNEFASLSGARIVRIACHPDVQKMGYGTRAIDLLSAYYQGNICPDSIMEAGVFGGEGSEKVSKHLRKASVAANADEDDNSDEAAGGESALLHEEIKPRAKLPPLLTALSSRPAERLHWLGVSFGLTGQLLNFWSRKAFKVCYVRQTCNDLTGEYSSIVLRELNCEGVPDAPRAGWLNDFVRDYRRRLVSLMSYSFTKIDTILGMTLLDPDRLLTGPVSDSSSASVSSLVTTANSVYCPMTAEELLNVHFTHHDMQRLELYARNMVDHHMIVDLLPRLAHFVFLGKLPTVRLSQLQVAILLATGLQHRDVDSIAVELDLPVNQVLAFFNKTIRKISTCLKEMVENHTAKELPNNATIRKMEKTMAGMTAGPVAKTLKQDQAEDEKAFKEQQRKLLMGHKDLAMHSVSCVSEGVLESALDKGIKAQKAIPKSISIPSSKASGHVNVLPPASDEQQEEDDKAVVLHETKTDKKFHKKKNNKRPQNELSQPNAKQTRN